MHTDVDERLRFLSGHWQDSMGWKAIPFWSVVAFEGFYAARSNRFQFGTLAVGIVLSWIWSRTLQGFVDGRIGIMRQPLASAQKVLWKRTLLLVLPLMVLVWWIGSAFSGQCRLVPTGWSENNLTLILSSFIATFAFQIVDDSNPLARRCCYALATLLWVVTVAAIGYHPFSYALGFGVYGGLQCALAVVDFMLLFRLAAPPAQDHGLENSHG